MLSFIITLLLIILALLTLILRKTYRQLPLKELKRQARYGDKSSKIVYRIVSYGESTNILLWAVAIVCFATGFVLMAHIVPSFFAFIIVALIIVLAFGYIPTMSTSTWSLRLAVITAPVMGWLLNYIHSPLDRLATLIHRHPIAIHTGLYEREDLLELLDVQRKQPDSRFSVAELELAMHALTYGDRMVSECMVPRREVRSVSADEAVSPIFIRELHDSGYSRFPVYSGDENHIVGTLYLRDLINLKHTGKVSEIMDQSVYYVHEDYPLEQALHAFLKTKHQLFIVVNNFEEFVGIITIEDILEQILGCKIVDEFDRYDDIRAVAANHARLEHKEHTKTGEEPEDLEKTSEDSTEVVQ